MEVFSEVGNYSKSFFETFHIHLVLEYLFRIYCNTLTLEFLSRTKMGFLLNKNSTLVHIIRIRLNKISCTYLTNEKSLQILFFFFHGAIPHLIRLNKPSGCQNDFSGTIKKYFL